MYIDTTSQRSMERSLCTYLNITSSELYQYIDYASEKATPDKWGFNSEIFNVELMSIISDLQPEIPIDEIQLHHLTRRLNTDGENNDGCNLKFLLTTETPLRTFLREHGVEFAEHKGHLLIIHYGSVVSLEDTNQIDVCYLRGRLGYNAGREDYCFNGFAMRDLLMKNSYARELYDGPEFLVVLSRFLRNKKIQKDFFENSTYFCLNYLLPINSIVFDGHEEMDYAHKCQFLISQVCHRLLIYQNSHPEYMYDHDNPILRLDDDAIVPASFQYGKEIITLDMLC